ncbi:hypothetical protein CXT94_10250 [Akkermansia muciniphila]|nr:hypothetical protein CXT94_10250 [Akkermansia muciniphila]
MLRRERLRKSRGGFVPPNGRVAGRQEMDNGIRIAGAGKRHGQKNSGRQGNAQGCPVSGCMIDKPEKRGMLLI